MALALTGSRMRERRRQLRLTQAALAAQLGISASYLNLIEANRRSIGGALLVRIAQALDLPIDAFDGAAQRRLVDELALIAADPVVAPLALAPASAAALVASPHAGWARALVGLHRAYLDRSAAVAALSDRLNQDPVLGETVHSILTHVTAIRSASEILEADRALEGAQRLRFIDIIANDSRRLSDVSRALATLFTQSQSVRSAITPSEQIDDFLAERDNHFAPLEQAADQLREGIGIDTSHTEPALLHYLAQQHGVTVRTDAAGDATRTLVLPQQLSEASRRFRLAQFCAQLGAQEAIGAQIAASTALLSAEAQQIGMRVLAAYVAGAMLMPYAEFRSSALDLRYDIDRLSDRFQTSIEQVCHRLVTLRRPGAEGIRFGFMRCDATGHSRKRLALAQWPQPRHGPGCPLWAIYQAFQTPGATVRQLVEFPGAERYLLVARTVDKRSAAFGMPAHRMSIMLVCDALAADQTVYGAGLDVARAAPALPVGPACRVCSRQDCSYRQEDAIVGAATLPLPMGSGTALG